MTTTSARPDNLDHAARQLVANNNRLADAVRRARSAAAAYAASCSDAPLDIASPGKARAAQARSEALGHDLTRVATGFRLADAAPGGPTATTADLTLSAVLFATFGQGVLDPELTAPTAAQARAGTVAGARMATMMAPDGPDDAARYLAGLTNADLADPTFAAALFNRLGAARLKVLVEYLVGFSPDWRHPAPDIGRVASAWATATHTLDSGRNLSHLEPALIASLLLSSRGRNVVRGLAGASTVSSGRTYLRRVSGVLLGRHPAPEDALPTASYRFLRGRDADGHSDSPLLAAITRTPGATTDLMANPMLGAEVEERTRTLLDRGPTAQLEVSRLLRQVLAAPEFQPTAKGNDRAREAVLRGTMVWVVEAGPRRVTEPLAQLLADTIVGDPTYYTGRADTLRDGDLRRFFHAITQYDRPWLITVAGFKAHRLRRVAESLHSPLEQRSVALVDLARLEDEFELAAAETDKPRGQHEVEFAMLKAVAGPVAGMAGSSISPLVGLAAKQAAERGASAWHDADLPEAGNHESRTRLARASARRDIWLAIATDPELNSRVNWSVGGSGPDRAGTVGSRITDVDHLVGLKRTDHDIDELAGWAEHQPADLRAIVATYLTATN